MALTFTLLFKGQFEDRRMHAFDIALDNSYPTGGEAVTADNVALSRIDAAIIAPNNGFVFEWDQANKKIKAFQGDNTNAAAAPLIQIGNAIDLSAETHLTAIFFGV